MDSILNLLFEKWENDISLPNGFNFGCKDVYCHDYIDIKRITIDELQQFRNVYFPISLNQDFNCILQSTWTLRTQLLDSFLLLGEKV